MSISSGRAYYSESQVQILIRSRRINPQNTQCMDGCPDGLPIGMVYTPKFGGGSPSWNSNKNIWFLKVSGVFDRTFLSG
jgi:hypothetical protein